MIMQLILSVYCHCQSGSGSGTEAGRPAGSRLREMTFLTFASVEYDGNVYMTPHDFLQSITEDKPRRKSVSLFYSFICEKRREYVMYNVPDVNVEQ